MHEATIADSILKIASARLSSHGTASSVASVKVSVGEFRNVDIESLLFAFDAIKAAYRGCEACQLLPDSIEARAKCRQCHIIYRPDLDRAFQCSSCGGGIGKLVNGEELDVTGVTLVL